MSQGPENPYMFELQEEAPKKSEGLTRWEHKPQEEAAWTEPPEPQASSLEPSGEEGVAASLGETFNSYPEYAPPEGVRTYEGYQTPTIPAPQPTWAQPPQAPQGYGAWDGHAFAQRLPGSEAPRYQPPVPVAYTQGGFPLSYQEHPQAQTILILGIMGFVVPFVSFVGWFLGRRDKREAKNYGWRTDGALNIGYILSIVGSILQLATWIFSLMLFLFALLLNATPPQ